MHITCQYEPMHIEILHIKYACQRTHAYTQSLDVYFSPPVFGGRVTVSPLGTAATSGPTVPDPMTDECSIFSGTESGKGSQSNQTKPAPIPVSP
jgi:hypothetical protein